MLPRCAILFCFLAWLLASASPVRATSEPRKKISEIYALSREQASSKQPVHIQGIVTFRTRSGIFLYDGEQNIWANKENLPANITDGSLVEIEGETRHIGYAPYIAIESCKRIGQEELPPPRRIAMDRLLSGSESSQQIEMEGVIQEAVPAKDHFLPLLVLAVEGQSCRIKVFGSIDPTKFIDARVRVHGIYQPLVNLRSQAVGLELFSRPQDIQILTPPPNDPFRAPHVSLHDLMRFSPKGSPYHRKVVTGQVTFIYPGNFFYIREDDLSLRIDGPTEDLAVGDIVEVAGFPSLTHTLASLRGIVLRKSGHQAPPDATDTTSQEILHPALSDPWAGSARSDQSGMVVRLRGRLLRTLSSPDNATRTLLIDSGGDVFPAYIPTSATPETTWHPGSDLELTGACELEFKSTLIAPESITHPINGFHLWLSSPDSVRVVSAPSWWTPQRLSLALGSALLVLLGVLVWSAWLRREVSRRGNLLAIEIAARQETRLEYEATMRERTRLANDLHDNLEQTLTGISLQLQAARLFRNEEPERSQQHIHLAQQFLDRSREDLHRTVWDLRVLGMEGKGFAEYLREKVAAITTIGCPAIEVVVTGKETPLPDFISGNLLLLAQEAITNALKHADAQLIRVHIDYLQDGISLCVEDDGKGFLPATAPDHREGHFGLQGMRERMKRLGGTLTINSAPGHGTRIESFVPTSSFYETITL